jgi:hypothetical protein
VQTPAPATARAPPEPERAATPDILAAANRYADPTERLAYLLGLDPLLLAHHTGLAGHDSRGAIARLKFALAHPVTRGAAGHDTAPAHQKLTKSVELKQRPRRMAPVIALPTPPSPHFQQVCSPVPGTSARVIHAAKLRPVWSCVHGV